jgi:hypothetical protein
VYQTDLITRVCMDSEDEHSEDSRRYLKKHRAGIRWLPGFESDSAIWLNYHWTYEYGEYFPSGDRIKLYPITEYFHD